MRGTVPVGWFQFKDMGCLSDASEVYCSDLKLNCRFQSTQLSENSIKQSVHTECEQADEF